MHLSNADERTANLVLGIRSNWGLATGYPDLPGKLDRLFADRIAPLPWVPRSWLAAVRDLQSKYPGDLMQTTPGRDALGRRGATAPSWADSDAKLDVWQAIYQAQQDAIVSYAKERVEEGEAELASLYADAAFWDGAYKLAVTVRDLPAAVVSAVGGGVSDWVGTFLPESLKAYAKWITWGLVILIVGGVVFWYRDKLSGFMKKAKL